MKKVKYMKEKTTNKKRENHEKHVKLMTKKWNSWKNRWNSWNSWKSEIHEKTLKLMKKHVKSPRSEIHGKNPEISWKQKRAIHKKNVKIMKNTSNSWKKHEIHDKNVKFMKKTQNSLTFMKNKVKFMQKTRSSFKKNVEFMKKSPRSEIHGKNPEISWKQKREIQDETDFVQAKTTRCDASAVSCSILILFYILLLTYVSPYLHNTDTAPYRSYLPYSWTHNPFLPIRLYLCFPLLYRLAFRFLPDWFAVWLLLHSKHNDTAFDTYVYSIYTPYVICLNNLLRLPSARYRHHYCIYHHLPLQMIQ